jgi:transposase
MYPEVRMGRYVLITVTDTGTGMSEEIRERVYARVNAPDMWDAHDYRKSLLDLGFVHEAVAECSSKSRGRPSIDPEVAVRMMLLGVLYDLSDRELCDEIQMHAGMRWFLGLNFHDPVPDHSTLSRLRNERWAKSELWQRLRDRVLEQCAEAGLLSGRHLSVDGTEMSANASMKSLRRLGPRPTDDSDDRDPPGPAPDDHHAAGCQRSIENGEDLQLL